jgi:PTS system nitrogen regulatory IIA component
MPLADLLAPERVALVDDPVDRDRVLERAARLLAADPVDPAGEAAGIAECLRMRERMGSTAIGHGVAIPHGRCSHFDGARAAFLRLRAPVDFDAGDGEPVDLVFAMTVPEHFTQQHLQLLSELAEAFAEPAFRESLRTAPDAAALLAALRRPRAG